MFPGIGKRVNEPVVDCRGKATTKKFKYWIESDIQPLLDPSVIKTSDLLEMMPETYQSESIPERLKSARPPTRGKSTGPMATLRVKTFEGTNHIIKLRYEDTLQTLRSYLEPIVQTDFNIMSYESNSGWKVITDETSTLLELKLTPRAALQLSKKAPKTKSQLISTSI